MSAPFLVLQHVACEPPAAYEDVLRAAGHDVVRVMVADGEPLPPRDGHAGIIAMGAPMSVNDVGEYPWLAPELDYVAAAVRAGTPYWGICFGAQLLAGALGADVLRGPEAEVGVLPVELTAEAADDPVFGGLPAALPAVQWHSDTFELPEGAVHLASSPAYTNQAFRWGRAYGLQFHLEAPAALVEEWLAIPEYAASLRATLGDGAADPFIAAIRDREAEMTGLATRLFSRWLEYGVWGRDRESPDAPNGGRREHRRMDTNEMRTTEILEPAASGLAAVLTGDVVAPGDPEWDVARRAWNLVADQNPALVALPADAADVVAIVDFARTHGLKVAPQGTGHNATAITSLADTVLVSTQRMRGVEIDAGARSARVQAGTLWIDVTEASSEHGLFPLSGSSPDVGVVGYTLGGGLSWLARKHGLAASHVTAIELVTPDGQLVRATADDHADLFWALRGGGGNFGIVTAMEISLFGYGEVYAGMMLWPYERAGEVLRAWRDWTRTAPEDVTTSMRVMHFPPLPELPDFLRGRSVAVIDGAFAGEAGPGAEAIAALRALEPELDTWAMVPAVALSRMHMDPEEPVPYLSQGAFLGELDEAALEAFEAHVQPGAPLMLAELRHLGGALARVPEGAGAVGSVDGEYLYFTVGIVMGPEMAEAVEAAGRSARAALAPYETESAFLNFAEQSDADPATFYTDAAYERLRAIRAAVDPHGLMVANHQIPAG